MKWVLIFIFRLQVPFKKIKLLYSCLYLLGDKAFFNKQHTPCYAITNYIFLAFYLSD